MKKPLFKTILNLLPAGCAIEIYQNGSRASFNKSNRDLERQFGDYKVEQIGAYVPRQSIVYLVKLGQKANKRPAGTSALIRLKASIRIVERKPSHRAGEHFIFIDNQTRDAFFKDAKKYGSETSRMFEIKQADNAGVYEKWNAIFEDQNE